MNKEQRTSTIGPKPQKKQGLKITSLILALYFFYLD